MEIDWDILDMEIYPHAYTHQVQARAHVRCTTTARRWSWRRFWFYTEVLSTNYYTCFLQEHTWRFAPLGDEVFRSLHHTLEVKYEEEKVRPLAQRLRLYPNPQIPAAGALSEPES